MLKTNHCRINMSNSEECLDDSKEKTIMSLNDDCFFKIYSFLPVVDWCSLRETCTRFRRISDECFKRQHQNFNINVQTLYGLNDLVSIEHVKSLIRNFGQTIKKLIINKTNFRYQDDPSTLLRLLDRYCIELEDLKLVGIELLVDDVGECGRLFHKLTRLVIDGWRNVQSFMLCLAQCLSLKKLEIIGMEFPRTDEPLTHQQFPSLESFTMRNCFDDNNSFIRQFFIQNIQLKEVKLMKCSPDRHGRVVNAFSIALPMLQSLSISTKGVHSQTVRHWYQRIPPLKKLEVDLFLAEDFEIDMCLSKLLERECLKELLIASFPFNNELLRRLCGLKTLNILKFANAREMTAEICKRLAGELPLLSEIHLIECVGFTFNEAVEFVNVSSSLQKLIFNRENGGQTSITKNIFVNLVKARREKGNGKTLTIFLNNDDLTETRCDFECNKCNSMLNAESGIVTLKQLISFREMISWHHCRRVRRRETNGRRRDRSSFICGERSADQDFTLSFDGVDRKMPKKTIVPILESYLIHNVEQNVRHFVDTTNHVCHRSLHLIYHKNSHVEYKCRSHTGALLRFGKHYLATTNFVADVYFGWCEALLVLFQISFVFLSVDCDTFRLFKLGDPCMILFIMAMGTFSVPGNKSRHQTALTPVYFTSNFHGRTETYLVNFFAYFSYTVTVIITAFLLSPSILFSAKYGSSRSENIFQLSMVCRLYEAFQTCKVFGHIMNKFCHLAKPGVFEIQWRRVGKETNRDDSFIFIQEIRENNLTNTTFLTDGGKQNPPRHILACTVTGKETSFCHNQVDTDSKVSLGVEVVVLGVPEDLLAITTADEILGGDQVDPTDGLMPALMVTLMLSSSSLRSSISLSSSLSVRQSLNARSSKSPHFEADSLLLSSDAFIMEVNLEHEFV
ncbi:hypothetical protein Bhyg_04429 [Pseudolycoriella hygida]|uniref:F-box domain-containing protein n=1 Tax=Pseudolycoriella hygida TaxID=35572 RepID=A0A9Q0SA67_9DIPT|nr:hypothetical protein Bhyg_04429 [Pseudolycoriella hygida]